MTPRSCALIVALFALVAAAARAQTYDAVRIDRADAQGILWTKAPAGSPRGVVVVIPGAQMTADRYTWLGDAQVAEGFAVALIEPAVEWRAFPGNPPKQVPVRYVAIPHALAGLEIARSLWPEAARANLIAIGHSLGAAVLLELLDPAEAARNPNTKAPAGFAGVTDLAAAIILGTSLQPGTGAITLPYRSEDRPLSAPAGTRVLFVAAENDGMAAPALMRKTAARYASPVRFETIAGANHLGWSPGRGPLDRPDLDRPAQIDAAEQGRRTLRLIAGFLEASR
jgi:hypothetical protein